MSLPVELLVCTTCRVAEAGPSAGTTDADPPRAGRVLTDRLAAALPQGVVLREVECLSNCSRGCTIALRGDGRWTYIYGNIDPDTHLEAVLDGISRYRDTPDGLVPWRERPEHFRKNCIARLSPLTLPMEAQGV